MKRISLTLDDIFSVPTAEIFDPDKLRPVYAVTMDTRELKKGALFVAIKGERFDGHTFVAEAEKKGAAAAVINKDRIGLYDNVNIPLITVDDTTTAYGDLAKLWRNKLAAQVISLTGSNGKTTTKDALIALLSNQFKTSGTAANNNNQLGVPLTILSAKASAERLVLEHGTNHFGEIPYTAVIAQPDIALITNIGLSHIEFLRDKRGVLKEKKALLDAAELRKGKILLNVDDPMLKKLVNKYTNVVTYGFADGADIKGVIEGYDKLSRANMSIESSRMKLAFTSPLAGEKNAANILAAAAAAITAGVKKENILKGLKKIKPAKGRLQIIRRSNYTLIDDTYNANVESTENALMLMAEMTERSRKIAVLGDMFELGEKSEELHRRLAKAVRKSGIDEVYVTGGKMKLLAQELKKSGIHCVHYSSRKQLAKRCRSMEVEDSLLLVKGSRGMKMEEFVTIFLEER